MLLALVSPVLAGLLINEVVYDPAGDEGGFEWVELCNNGSSTVDLTGYQLENAGSSFTEVYTFASGTLAPGAYLLVGSGSSTHAATFSPNLQNGGDTDALRIKDGGGTVLDTVLYDDPNDNGLAEDSGTIPSAGAPAATSGKSFGRFPDCADTNVSLADFVLYAVADVTPGAVNAEVDSGGGDDTGPPPVDADCAGSPDVVINELRYATGEEYIELYNAGSSTVNLSDWELAFGTQPGSTTELAIPAGTTLAPGAFWVVGSAGASYRDFEADLEDMGNASSADGVLLTCNGARVDTVIYASDNADGWTDDSGAVATSLAPKPGSSESIARVEDGLDTNQCAVDFLADIPSPGLSNTAAPVGDADCANADGITINELVYSTDAEWIELYNGGGSAVALDAWVLQFGTSSYNKEFEIPDGTTLAAGDWLVLGTDATATVAASLDFGNASDTDAVRITCNSTPIDTVLYGEPDADMAWLDDTGALGTSFAPKHGDGESLARSSDGYDTDASGLDFVLSESPSPGEANPYVPPPVCESGAALGVKVNEFIYNPEGTDTGSEWVELVNTGDAAIRLDAWVIEVAGTDWDDKFTFPTGAELAPGDYLLVGGDNAGGDLVADSLTIDNASSGAGGVRIVDCEGLVVDTVLYGGDIEDPITGDGGSMEVVPETAEGASLGRYPNGEDSDAAADWHPYGEPTPGAANTDPGATDDTGGGGGGGCNDDKTPPKPGESGCTTVLPFGGLEVGLAALALLRRRRRA